MARLCRCWVAALAVAGFAAVVNAEIKEIGPFTGDSQEKFNCRVVFKPCMSPDCTEMFGSEDNALCTPGKAGTHTTGGWSFRCVIRARSAPLFFGSAQGWVRYTFDPPIGKFGGYFGSNAPNRGENNDAEVRFRDEDGNSLGTGIAKVGDGDCLWHWNGWETTGALIAEIDVEGKLFGGAFIDMDDMEISAGGGSKCSYTLKKSKPRGGCNSCPKKGSEFKSEQGCEVKKDCKRKVRTTISCPEGEGKCKLVAKKRKCE